MISLGPWYLPNCELIKYELKIMLIINRKFGHDKGLFLDNSQIQITIETSIGYCHKISLDLNVA